MSQIKFYNTKYKAVVIGCGSIGAMKEDRFDSPVTSNILTIAHAFSIHPVIDFIGVIDKDIFKAKQAAKKWNTKYFESYSDIMEDIDIVAICVDTCQHLKVITEIIISGNRPKVLMLEKPMGENIVEAEEILRLCEKYNIKTVVDYIRRYSNKIIEVKQELALNAWGQIYSASLVYGRGILREASHALNLFQYFFGDFVDGEIFTNDIMRDFMQNDPTYAAHLSFKNCPHVFMMPADSKAYAVYDINIYTEKGKISFVEHGRFVEFTFPLLEPVYGNYNYLPRKYETIQETDLTTALYNYVSNAIEVIEGGEAICSGYDAYMVHKIYERILR